ncbi:hypothetical protein Tco_0521488, partial [Tanacetum coccineum]
MQGMLQVWRQVEALGDDVDLVLPQSTFTILITALIAFVDMKSGVNFLEAFREQDLAVMQGMLQVWRQVEALGDDVDLVLPQSTFTILITALIAFV